MAEQSAIEWCDSTFNPWIGCTRVGPGCDDCYAARSTPARTLGIEWGPHAARHRTSTSNWAQPLRWEREHLEFEAQHGRRRRVFCASLADVFDNAAPREWRQDLYELIYSTPHLDWLLVTKRIGNVSGMLPARGHLPSNVWLGITVVNQAEADRDIGRLLQVPAHVRFLSMEPLLGPVHIPEVFLQPLNWGEGPKHWPDGMGTLDWVIVGGESGPKARPMHPAWVRSIRDQCAAAGVPFLFKQWGEWVPRSDCYHRFADGKSCADLDPGARRWPCVRLTERGHNGRDLAHADSGCDAYMQKVGKAMAGRLLDGIEHNGFPGGGA